MDIIELNKNNQDLKTQEKISSITVNRSKIINNHRYNLSQ